MSTLIIPYRNKTAVPRNLAIPALSLGSAAHLMAGTAGKDIELVHTAVGMARQIHSVMGVLWLCPVLLLLLGIMLSAVRPGTTA